MEWIDGEALFDWLENERGVTISGLELFHPTLARRARYWKDGGNAHYATVDRFLIALDLHLTDLPDEVWRETQRKKHPRHLTAEVREEVLQRAESEPKKALAREYGICAKTIRNWQRRSANQESRAA